MVQHELQDTYPNTVQTIVIAIIAVVLGMPILVALLLTLCALVGFSANVVQFCIDQLQNAPTDESVLFIHWYVWTNFTGLLFMTGVFIGTLNDTILLLPVALILLGITVTVCLQRCISVTGLLIRVLVILTN